MAVKPLERVSKPFYLEEYLDSVYNTGKEGKQPEKSTNINQKENFIQLCREVKSYMESDWEKAEGKKEDEKFLVYQIRAIVGHQKEVNFFKDKITAYLKKYNFLNHWHPNWYTDLTSAIFHENWGLAGIEKWKRNPNSSSCKIIGNRIYYMENGKQKKQEQTISLDRLNQLKQGFLLLNPKQRLEDHFGTIYMLDGTRVTIYDSGLAKEPSIVFRKYVVDEYNFEAQARLGTIPEESIPIFKAMVDIGYNVAFVGPVRTAKTTFLTTWQSYEDPTLEGVMVETDPEIPLHMLMPDAPIIQLVAEGERLRRIMPDILRSDGNYLVMAEARDGVALKIALDVTKKGTRRVKLTFHTGDPIDFCYDVAQEIVNEFGADLWATTVKVAKGYHYIFDFIELKDKSKKRLNGVHEIRYDLINYEITIHKICEYNPERDDWSFHYTIGKDKEAIGVIENKKALEVFHYTLKEIADKNQIQAQTVFTPIYTKLMNRGIK